MKTSKKIISTEFANKSIIINNLTFQYEGKHSPKVLNDINLIIKENTVTAIVGASGSGKTTLINYFYNIINLLKEK